MRRTDGQASSIYGESVLIFWKQNASRPIPWTSSTNNQDRPFSYPPGNRRNYGSGQPVIARDYNKQLGFHLLSSQFYTFQDELYCQQMWLTQKLALYRGADKSLARRWRKQARKHVRDVRDFYNIETRAVINFFFKVRCRRKFTPFWQKH